MSKFEHMTITAYGYDHPKVYTSNKSEVGKKEARHGSWFVEGPHLSDYIIELGEQGWEVCGAYGIWQMHCGVVLLKRTCNSEYQNQ